MSELVPIPPTYAIQDPEARAVLDAVAQNIRSAGDVYVQKSELADSVTQTVVDVITGNSPGGSSNIVNTIARDIISSELYEILKTPFGPRTLEEAIGAEAMARMQALFVERTELQAQIQSEVDARTTALSNEASTRAQAILDEAAARTTADSALQTQINLLTAGSSGDLGTLLAAVGEETTARIAGDEAEATQRSTLAAQLRGSYTGSDINALTTGLLYSEKQARVSADSAEATARQALETTVNNPSTGLAATRATLLTDYYTKSTVDTALSQLSTTLTTNYASADAAVLSSAQSYTYSKSETNAAITSASNTLTAAYQSADTATLNSAKSYTQTYAYAKSDGTSLASQVSTLTTSTNNNTSAITSEGTTRSSKDDALAAAINNIWAKMGGTAAAITDSALAAVSPSAAAATKWNQVTAAVTDPNTGTIASASILQTFNTYASSTDSSINGLKAQYTLKLDVNGYVTGFGLASTVSNGVPSSAFIINADKFALVKPGTTTQAVPFAVDSGGNAVFTGTVYAGTNSTIDWGSLTNPPGPNLLDNPELLNAENGALTAPGWSRSTSGTVTQGSVTSLAAQYAPPWDPTAPVFYGAVGAASSQVRWLTGYIPVNTATNYTVAGWARAKTAGAVRVSLGLLCYDDANASRGNVFILSNYAVSATWTRYSGVCGPNGTAFPAGTTKVRVAWYGGYNNAGTTFTGESFGTRFTFNEGTVPTNNYAPSDTSVVISSARNVLSGGGGFVAGNLTWDSSGVRTGGYGVAMTVNGLAAYKSDGTNTLFLDGTTGDATFGGALSAATGTFAGTLTADAVNAVDTINLAGNAITVPVGASATYTGTPGTTTTILTTSSFDTKGQPLYIHFHVIGTVNNTSAATVSVKLGGTTLRTLTNTFFSPGINNVYDMFGPIYVASPGSGSKALTVTFQSTGTADLTAHVFALGCKR